MMGIQTNNQHRQGFTIVELIIVILVIGILAAITIVSYAAVTSNSHEQSLQGDIKTAAGQLLKYRSDNGAYPADLSSAGIKNSSTTTYTYTYTSANDTYCLVGTAYNTSFYVLSGNSTPKSGNSCT